MQLLRNHFLPFLLLLFSEIQFSRYMDRLSPPSLLFCLHHFPPCYYNSIVIQQSHMPNIMLFKYIMALSIQTKVDNLVSYYHSIVNCFLESSPFTQECKCILLHSFTSQYAHLRYTVHLWFRNLQELFITFQPSKTK